MEYLKGQTAYVMKPSKRFGLGYSNKYSNDLYKYLKSKGIGDDQLARESGLMNVDEKSWNV